MKQPDRPAQITAILKTMDSKYPAEMAASLEAYIADLEAQQQAVPLREGATLHDPTWFYWHGVKRAQNRRERALRKQNNYSE
jgi:hypothetical protein